ncbi:Dephospho-CoA kinase [Yarrowia sp. B02]|nr:Dephospho-CoA kinase [Yarrowia sp. B02]
MSSIVIVPPNSSWPQEFEQLRAKIASVAPKNAKIDHIGSTSVPDLAAKDVIDIQMSVEKLEDVDVEQLKSIGYVQSEGVKVDHCPPGQTLEPEELRKLFFKQTGRPSNLHVREFGRFNQQYPLLCRDYLRSHPHAAAAYAEIKIQLAKRFADDVDSYYDIKDPVFDLIMEGAREWQKRL